MGPKYLFLPIFTYIYHIFLPILNIFIHISTYFHVYFYLFLHIYHIFLLFSTYLLLFSCILLLISTYLLLFSTCRALHLLLPASPRSPQKCVVFTTDCHKSVLHLLQFTGIYLYLPHKCGILLQFTTKVWHIRAPKCARKTGTNKLCAQCARFLALIWHRIYSSTRWQIFDILKNFNTPHYLFRSYL